MQYITHHPFKGKALSGEDVDIPYGTTFDTIGRFIVYDDKKVLCKITSLNAHQYFARNDDGQGLLRGRITHAIAYDRLTEMGGFYFTDAQQELLNGKWSRFIIPDSTMILFNHAFFNARIVDLKEMIKDLGIQYMHDVNDINDMYNAYDTNDTNNLLAL